MQLGVFLNISSDHCETSDVGLFNFKRSMAMRFRAVLSKTTTQSAFSANLKPPLQAWETCLMELKPYDIPWLHDISTKKARGSSWIIDGSPKRPLERQQKSILLLRNVQQQPLLQGCPKQRMCAPLQCKYLQQAVPVMLVGGRKNKHSERFFRPGQNGGCDDLSRHRIVGLHHNITGLRGKQWKDLGKHCRGRNTTSDFGRRVKQRKRNSKVEIESLPRD